VSINLNPEPIKYTKTSYLVGCHLGISLGSASVCYNKTTSKLLLDQDLIFFFFFLPYLLRVHLVALVGCARVYSP